MTDDIERLVEAARALAERTGHAVVIIGGVARSVWASPRATQDLDVIYGGPLPEAVAAAPHIGLVAVPNEVAALAGALMTRLRLPQRLTGPVRMDVVAASHPYYDRLIARSRPRGQGGLRIAAPEDIILLKLIADRPLDRADVPLRPAMPLDTPPAGARLPTLERIAAPAGRARRPAWRSVRSRAGKVPHPQPHGQRSAATAP